MDTGRIDDRLLLELFRQGDRDALASLYRLHQPSIYRFALYMTDDPDASAEVVQETFLWLIHHPSAFDPDRGSLRCFLSGVARNILQHRRRDRRRFEPLTAIRLAEPAAIGSRRDDAEIDAGAEAGNLQAAIRALPDSYREVLILCGIENKSYEEAAAILACAVGTVRSRLHRAKLYLARKLTRDASRKLATKGKPIHG
jgi:RNA polymerase sigma-70 factor, ECF subfamily